MRHGGSIRSIKIGEQSVTEHVDRDSFKQAPPSSENKGIEADQTDKEGHSQKDSNIQSREIYVDDIPTHKVLIGLLIIRRNSHLIKQRLILSHLQ
jgi:hypothetical protein